MHLLFSSRCSLGWMPINKIRLPKRWSISIWSISTHLLPKSVLDILILFESIHLGDGDQSVIIKWHYHEDDEDMEDTGVDFDDIVEVPFEMCPHS